MEFFNAQPYFASFALGATARLEEQNSVERWDSARPISVFKNRLCGPLGAIGDRLFWGTVRPLAAMIGVFVTLFFGIIGPILLFVIYNIPHIYLRYYGISKGYKLGFDVVRELNSLTFFLKETLLRRNASGYLIFDNGYANIGTILASHICSNNNINNACLTFNATGVHSNTKTIIASDNLFLSALEISNQYLVLNTINSPYLLK